MLQNCWPGPITIIFKATSKLPSYYYSKQGTIALRCPDHTGLQEILQSFDGLFSTSANRSSEPIPKTLYEINTTIFNSVALIVNHQQQYLPPSSIIDVSALQYTAATQDTTQKIKVIRKGLYPLEELEELYGESFIKSTV